MLKLNAIWRLGAIGLIGSALTLAAACGGGDGIPKEDYDKVQQQLQDKQLENDQLQKQVTDLQKDDSAGKPANGVIDLLGAQKLPPASPTPVPTGSPTPAPARETPSAAFYDSAVGPYYVYVETLATTTRSKYDVASTVSCTASATFARGQRIVWRFEVIDTATDKRITDKDGATLKLVLPNGDEVTARFSQRGGGRTPGAPFMWSANWDIPLDYPLGGIDYKLTITNKDAQTTTWKPPALVSETTNTLPKVIQ